MTMSVCFIDEAIADSGSTITFFWLSAPKQDFIDWDGRNKIRYRLQH